MKTLFKSNKLFKKQLFLLFSLVKEAGYKYLIYFSTFSLLSSILDFLGIGIFVSLIFEPTKNRLLRLDILELGVYKLFLILMIVVLLRGISKALISTIINDLRNNFSDKLREEFLENIFYTSKNSLNNIGRGELKGLVLNNISRSVWAVQQTTNLIQSILAVMIFGIGFVFYNLENYLVIIIGFVACILSSLITPSYSWELGLANNKINDSLINIVSDSLSSVLEIRALSVEQWLIKRFKLSTSDLRKVLRSVIKRELYFIAFRDVFIVLLLGLLVFSSTNSSNITLLSTSLLLAYKTANSTSKVIKAKRSLLSALPGYSQLIDLRKKIDHNPYKTQLINTKTDYIKINFSNFVSIEWESVNDHFLNNYIFKKGNIYVIKGPNGSGKTTFLDQFTGINYDGNSNWVIKTNLISHNINGIKQSLLVKNLISYFPQKSILFEASMRDNLLLGREGIFQSKLEEAEILSEWFKKFSINYPINNTKEFNKILNLSNISFSGGEINLICLIRCWIMKSLIEVLDEPTSSLDDQRTKLVVETINSRKSDRIQIIVSHDKRILDIADKIISFRNKIII